MAVERTGQTLPGIEASGDMSSNQFRFVRIDGNGRAVLAGAGESIVGVLQNKPSALGQPAIIWGPGSVTKVVAGGSVAASAVVTPDASGRAVGAAGDTYIAGISVETGGTSDLLTVLICQPGRSDAG